MCPFTTSPHTTAPGNLSIAARAASQCTVALYVYVSALNLGGLRLGAPYSRKGEIDTGSPSMLHERCYFSGCLKTIYLEANPFQERRVEIMVVR